ncbi:hypothetical protein JCGZ_22330 [Jatropha curcas]|uniref:Phospholipase D n=1 Tax=Jatropha curcas TaxID=180498 RepID=A0A067L937_JATCU|nr:hypothetical protein JCGZ_22330 [Jatropha curcas]
MASEISGSNQQPIYLHGDLDLYIIQARTLPNMDIFRSCYAACTPESTTSAAATAPTTDKTTGNDQDEKIHHRRRIVNSDPYVTVVVPQATVARTRVVKNARNPKWKERFYIALAHPVIDLEFHVKDNALLRSENVGVVKIPARRIATGEVISDWFPIIGYSGKPPKPDTALHLEMKFTPCEKNPLYKHGIAGDPEQRGVRNTYFPLRKGSKLTMYQDAHVLDDELPEIKIDDGKVFKQQKCWEDICYAISEAHHLIYVVGWSVFYKIKLVREPTRPLPRGGDLTLGELLKYKSAEGVRVLLLVWDDVTSRSIFGITTIVGTVFTHHQKCVLVDTQAAGNNRKITAFLGGLDLCDGRYDTPEHRLFRDLDTVFHGDFHNITFTDPLIKTPRQPWHDLHCRIDGPAAYDVLINFEQRWKKETKWTKFGLLFRKVFWDDDSLLKIERMSWILSPPFTIKDDMTVVPPDDPTVHVSSEEDPENWHVQVFRSIDNGSVKGFPKTVHQCRAQNLMTAKNQVIERSIQAAYIQAIRSAQHFIYIENQYFLGSSYGWPSYENAGVDNLIPMELALKVASKIRANERFAVYIVVPMWPEGVPTSGPMQEILYWQSQTMQMMYNIVAQEIKSMQLVDSHPKDYLNFYCLGKREENTQQTVITDDEMVSDSQKFQRFTIYVHAKGIIVDDEYAIIGSANINQRSMAGTKDTEIAMGAYQPHQTWAAKKKHPRGQIYGFRMSLWAEHFGEVQGLFMEPQSLDCVKTVNKIAEENWKRYTDPDFKVLQGQLLNYPVQVDADGKVGALSGFENFPDVGGKVLGTHTIKVPDILTT